MRQPGTKKARRGAKKKSTVKVPNPDPTAKLRFLASRKGGAKKDKKGTEADQSGVREGRVSKKVRKAKKVAPEAPVQAVAV